MHTAVFTQNGVASEPRWMSMGSPVKGRNSIELRTSANSSRSYARMAVICEALGSAPCLEAISTALELTLDTG